MILLLIAGVVAAVLFSFYLSVLIRRIVELSTGNHCGRTIKIGLFCISFIGFVLTLAVFRSVAIVIVYVLLFAALFDGMFFGARLIMRKMDKTIPELLVFLHKTTVLPLVCSIMLTGYGIYNMNVVRQTTYTVTSSKVADEYTVVFLSDIHYGTIQDKEAVANIVEELEKMPIDFLVLGGDIVDEGTSKDDVEEIFSRLGALKTRYGIYYVWGNHDRSTYSVSPHFTEKDILGILEKNDIRILKDQHVPIGDDMTLIGREDRGMGGSTRATTQELVADVPRDNFILLADHQPRGAEDNARVGVDLQLSGHTHAMQIWPAGTIAKLLGAYVYGRYDIDNFSLILSSGVAGWGVGLRTENHCEYVIVHICPEK